ncbi:MAG: response regulator [Syntrophobacterales bacterium]|jgi:chemotaxis protein histidine kinase CheA/ActR/RegA family two-component response regulator
MTEDTDLFLTLKDDYREALEQFNDALLRLESDPEDRDSLDRASRQLHNVKGFANRMRAPKLGQLAHIFEDVLEAISLGRFQFEETLANLLFKGIDLFVHYLRTREVPSDKVAELVEEIEPLLFTTIEAESAATDMEPLLPDFIAAARDNVEAINRGLSSLEKDPTNSEIIREVYRNAHSLKGSALTMGFERMGKLAHYMEDVLRAIQKGQLPVTPKACDALFETNDALSVMLDTLAVSKRMKVDAESSMKRLASLLPDIGPEEEPRVAEPVRPVIEPSEVSATTVPAVDSVRVSTARLDELINLAGEAAIAQIRLASEVDGLMRIRESWQRLRLKENFSQHSILESDAGSINQFLELGDSLEETSRRLQEAAENTSRHIEALQHRSMEIRMLPLALVFNTLPRAVRDLSRQFGKQVSFRVEGERTTIDKRILEQIGDPLIHLLRNALDHGIETPEVRRQSGKPETAIIHLKASQEGGKVLITLADDGQGIDHERLKEIAIGKGLIDGDEVKDWTQAQLLELIFLPGFSTSSLVTDVSGRGVGMDVVRANVERLKGQVEVTSELGKKTKFVISLPVTLATVHALMIQCAGEILAIPTFSITKTLQVPINEIRPIQGRQAVVHQGEILPVRSLVTNLGWEEENGGPLAEGRALVVVTQAGERRVGFLVDDILGEREIVIKDLGSHLRKVSCVAGATILGSGEVALILDIPQLLWQKPVEVRQEWPEQLEEEVSPGRSQLILVVEDQVVTRQMEKSILEAAGFRVVTAENGLDALEKLRQQSFDLVVTDILMPKMDGFTLTKEIRDNERTKNLPVVVVTSMEREADKRRGLEVGADAYLVKSSFDQIHLIDIIENLLGKRRVKGQGTSGTKTRH